MGRRLVVSFHPKESGELRELLKERDLEISEFFRGVIDASIEFIFDLLERRDRMEVSLKEAHLLEALREEAKGPKAGRQRDKLAIYPRETQLIPLGGLSKHLGLSYSEVVRMLFGWWREGLLDRWLPPKLRRKYISEELEEERLAAFCNWSSQTIRARKDKIDKEVK